MKTSLILAITTFTLIVLITCFPSGKIFAQSKTYEEFLENSQVPLTEQEEIEAIKELGEKVHAIFAAEACTPAQQKQGEKDAIGLQGHLTALLYNKRPCSCQFIGCLTGIACNVTFPWRQSEMNDELTKRAEDTIRSLAGGSQFIPENYAFFACSSDHELLADSWYNHREHRVYQRQIIGGDTVCKNALPEAEAPQREIPRDDLRPSSPNNILGQEKTKQLPRTKPTAAQVVQELRSRDTRSKDEKSNHARNTRERKITPDGRTQAQIDAELVDGLRADLAKRRNN